MPIKKSLKTRSVRSFIHHELFANEDPASELPSLAPGRDSRHDRNERLAMTVVISTPMNLSDGQAQETHVQRGHFESFPPARWSVRCATKIQLPDRACGSAASVRNDLMSGGRDKADPDPA